MSKAVFSGWLVPAEFHLFVSKYLNPFKRRTPLYGGQLELAPRMSGLEGFHYILGKFLLIKPENNSQMVHLSFCRNTRLANPDELRAYGSSDHTKVNNARISITPSLSIRNAKILGRHQVRRFADKIRGKIRHGFIGFDGNSN